MDDDKWEELIDALKEIDSSLTWIAVWCFVIMLAQCSPVAHH